MEQHPGIKAGFRDWKRDLPKVGWGYKQGCAVFALMAVLRITPYAV